MYPPPPPPFPHPPSLQRIESLAPEIVVTSCACGENFTLLATAGGRVFAFGANSCGQLGLGHRAQASSPEELTSLRGAGVTTLAAGCTHSLSLATGGRLWSWGDSEVGQTGHADGDGLLPRRLLDGEAGVAFVSIAAGRQHSAAAAGDGGVYTWGDNQYGQLGRKIKEDGVGQRTPRRAAIDAPVDRVACGAEHTVAMSTRTGDVWAWGRSESLGSTRPGSGVSVPTLVHAEAWERMGRPEKIAAGDSFTAVLVAGQIYTWGCGAEGRLGSGTSRNAERPQIVPPEFLLSQQVDAIVASPHSSLTLAIVYGVKFPV